MLVLIGLLVFLAFCIAGYWIWKNRRESITGIPARNRHFAQIGRQLQLMTSSDGYFLQLEGEWKGTPVLVYPHNFHGPGSITLFYADTGVPCQERSWIEPTISLGRAITNPDLRFSYEYVGDPSLQHPRILKAIENYRLSYPFVAITLPTRFVFSHYVLQVLSGWKNYVVFLALDAGRKPAADRIAAILDDALSLATIVREAIGGVTPNTST